MANEYPVPTEPIPILEPLPDTRRARRAARAVGAAAIGELGGFGIMPEVETRYAQEGEDMRARVIDQDPAIDAIIGALDRLDVRTADDTKPIATYAFLGPTGVGKTETAKALAEVMGNVSGAKMIRIDCSDFSRGHEISKLTGSPPGYVSREQKPLLNKKDVEPFGTVILFDEIEKGSPELYNLLLQITSDGRLHLNNGETVSFRDAFVVFTSNLGAKQMMEQLSGKGVGFAPVQPVHERQRLASTAVDQFDQFFTPEFVNRITKKIVFHPLTPDGLGRVLDSKIAQRNTEYESKRGIHITLSAGAREYLVSLAAAKPGMGARPLMTHIEELLETPLGRQLANGAAVPGTEIKVFTRHEHPRFHHVPGDAALVFTSRFNAELRAKQIPPASLALVPVSKPDPAALPDTAS